MSRYRIEGMIVDTDNATASWEEGTRWNGNNHISLATGSQWDHQKLYRSRRGRYWLELARMPIDEVEKRVRVIGTLVEEGRVLVEGVSLAIL